jgi:hypothetical protein
MAKKFTGYRGRAFAEPMLSQTQSAMPSIAAAHMTLSFAFTMMLTM